MICKKCQKEINDNSKFCPNCGTTIEYEIPNAVLNNQVYNQNMNNNIYTQTPNYYNQPVQNKNNNTKIAIIIAIVIIVVFFLIVGAIFIIPFVYISSEINENRSNINEVESNIVSNYNNSNSNSSDNEVINSLSAWNMYSNVRDKYMASYSKVISGNWVVLSNNNDTYWRFNNNTFYWYKSVNDLKDNYWYGSTKIYTGAEAFNQVGIKKSKMDEAIIRSNGKVTEKDFVAVICTPTKLVANGVDKSNTIKPGTVKKTLWVLVDHGSEGIEGQFLDIASNDTAYFFKIIK